ncbi:MAG TPA: hypothetical protein VJ744_08690 [Gaiellaceae bacterium]|nr:hypothetical protein [Gaiellaceae bacterium]
MHALERSRAAADRVVERVARVGADPRDDADLGARKALLVLISVLILPIAALWGVLYLALGSPVGVVPLVYFGVMLAGIAVFVLAWWVARRAVTPESATTPESPGPV